MVLTMHRFYTTRHYKKTNHAIDELKQGSLIYETVFLRAPSSKPIANMAACIRTSLRTDTVI